MARPTRSSRRVPLKYSEDENVLPPKPKKTRTDSRNVAKLRSTDSAKEAEKAVKGKLSTVKNVSGFDSSVLRDRTNLDNREIKADILMKKGGGKEASGKTKKNPVDDAGKKISSVKKVSVVDKSDDDDAEKKVSSVKNKRPKDADKKEPRRSLRRSTDLKEVGKPIETKRKFFKSKAKRAENDAENISPEKKLTVKAAKQKKIIASKKSRLSRSFRLRQTTLEESFSKENAKKTLRPRRNVKNYREDTVLEKSSIKTTDDGKKLPVYKSIKTTDNSDEESEIYEFRYNSNDSRERIQKKKKRKKATTGVVAKKSKGKKLTNVRTTARTAFTRIEELPEEDNQVPPNDQNDVDSSPVANIEEPVETSKPKAKPTVIESVDLKGEKRINLDVTPQIINPKRAVRKTSAFVVQPNVPYRAMLNHALLNKSISPITKAIDNFDPGSPWRAPALPNQEFFRVKSVVQSTPQIHRVSTVPKPPRTLSTVKDSENLQTSPKKDEKAMKNLAKPVCLEKSPRKFGNEISNVKTTNSGAKVLKENFDKSPRKFGTEISNVNASTFVTSAIIENTEETASKQLVLPAKSPRKFGTDISNANITPIDAEEIIEYGDDKENSAPNSSPQKTSNSLHSRSPLRALNFENQAGPSGIQKRSPLTETRLLKQSNLNNFLNLENLPTGTRITTVHGIFDDPESEPINGKSKKKIDEPNVQNAFGFDDEELNESSAIFTSPIKSSNVPNRIGRKKLLAKVEKTKESKSENKSIEIDKPFRPPIIAKPKINSETTEKEKKQDLPKFDELKTFTDTFDISIDQDVNNDKGENLLFADLEPVHFKQPPRHLYKRKRNAACITYSEDEDENGNAAGLVNHPTKKRKISKLEKQQQKKLEKWAKDLNSTFEEIDHFDLIVE